MHALLLRMLGSRTRAEMNSLVEGAVTSLTARGIVEGVYREYDATLRLHWSRGNYGHRLQCRRDGRRWELLAWPITNPAGPYAINGVDDEVCALSAWVHCGKEQVVPSIQSMTHMDIVERIAELEGSHPVPAWFSSQCEQLAKGKALDNDALRGMVLLGARRYFKTLPNSDRMQRAIEPALMTLLRAGSLHRTAANDVDGEQIIAGEDYARALVEVLQETHPLEARRAAHACFSQMNR